MGSKYDNRALAHCRWSPWYIEHVKCRPDLHHRTADLAKDEREIHGVAGSRDATDVVCVESGVPEVLVRPDRDVQDAGIWRRGRELNHRTIGGQSPEAGGAAGSLGEVHVSG